MIRRRTNLTMRGDPHRKRRSKLIFMTCAASCLAFLLLLGRPGGQVSSVAAQAVWSSTSMMVSNGTQVVSNSSLVTPIATSQPAPTSQATATPSAANSNISSVVVRIAQLDPTQYNSQADWNLWAYSACSTASMAEVLNAWWGYSRYRIADVLQMEVAAKAISPQSGLLDNDGIRRTMRKFGFDTTTPAMTLDQVIETANRGMPVIVGFPPGRYIDSGGHLAVVIGGDSKKVMLADSSARNNKKISRTLFLAWWGGFAAITIPDPYSIYSIGHATLTASFVNQVLSAYGSPMINQGQDILDTLAKNHIDPAIALAFFLHESKMGTTGEARKTLAWGNSRCVKGYRCIKTDGSMCPDPAVESCYAAFDSWLQGLGEWCWQITNPLYAAGGRVLVDDIIPVYAPTADGNDEAGYIASLKHAADVWRAGGIIV